MSWFYRHKHIFKWRNVLTILLFSCSILILRAQQVPSLPLSTPIFHPMVLNPAYVGSKDFTNISLTSKVSKYPNNQILNIHKRFKTGNNEFSPIGGGAYLFHERLDASWNTGISIAGSYHLSLDDEGLNNLSFGAGLKGFLCAPRLDVDIYPDTSSALFKPNLDLGIYYYGPRAYAGLSVTTLVPGQLDTTMAYAFIDRQYNFLGGYKFIINKTYGVVIEPSVLLSVNDKNIKELHKHITPYLRVYLQNFYIGSYLKDLDIFALFFQYQFPKFYTGLFLEFPRIGYLNDENIIFEISLGLNLGSGGTEYSNYRHW